MEQAFKLQRSGGHIPNDKERKNHDTEVSALQHAQEVETWRSSAIRAFSRLLEPLPSVKDLDLGDGFEFDLSANGTKTLTTQAAIDEMLIERLCFEGLLPDVSMGKRDGKSASSQQGTPVAPRSQRSVIIDDTQTKVLELQSRRLLRNHECRKEQVAVMQRNASVSSANRAAIPYTNIEGFSPHDEKAVARTQKALELQRQLRFRHWRHSEDIEKWRSSALRAFAQLSAPLPSCEYLGLGEGFGFDLSTHNTRLSTTHEIIEEMLREQLCFEGLLTDGGRDKRDAIEGCARQDQWCRFTGEHDAVGQHLHSANAASIASRKRPGLRSYRECKEDRTALMQRTSSGRLARHRCRDTQFVTANRASALYVFNSAIKSDPHRLCTERIARRCSTTISNAKMEIDSACLDPTSTTIPQEFPRLAADEVVLTVAVCNTHGHKEQEYDILASQSLYELRDAFHFASDWMFDGPARVKSGCFFINGIFYKDDRDPTAADYSTSGIELLKSVMPEGFLRKRLAQSMKARLCDLGRLCFGRRYTYIHQGDVEHGIYFTGMRIAQPQSDCPLVEAYPVLTFMRRYVKRVCCACKRAPAVSIVLGSSRCPHNPGFWCASCFQQFFQDRNGKPLLPVDYKVFPYLHDDF